MHGFEGAQSLTAPVLLARTFLLGLTAHTGTSGEVGISVLIVCHVLHVAPSTYLSSLWGEPP